MDDVTELGVVYRFDLYEDVCAAYEARLPIPACNSPPNNSNYVTIAHLWLFLCFYTGDELPRRPRSRTALDYRALLN